MVCQASDFGRDISLTGILNGCPAHQFSHPILNVRPLGIMPKIALYFVSFELSIESMSPFKSLGVIIGRHLMSYKRSNTCILTFMCFCLYNLYVSS